MRHGFVGMDVVDAPDIHDFIGYEFTYVKGDLSDSQSRETLVDIAAKKKTYPKRFL